MGIQAPAKKSYCPNLLAALDAVACDPRTAGAYSGFMPPWTFFNTAGEYAELYRRAGFSVPFAKGETITTSHRPDEVMTIFESGAAAGYLNPEYYLDMIDGAYTKAFRDIIRESFRGQADHAGKVKLVFNRIYLAAVK
jgi:trans-aconitate 2-methyltransferase